MKGPRRLDVILAAREGWGHSAIREKKSEKGFGCFAGESGEAHRGHGYVTLENRQYILSRAKPTPPSNIPHHRVNCDEKTAVLSCCLMSTEKKNAQTKSCQLCFMFYCGDLTEGCSPGQIALRNYSEEVREEPGYIGVLLKETCNRILKDYC